MAREIVNGIGIEYEVHGPDSGHPVILTPGGRFSMEAIGVREFAEALAKLGLKAILWDRPNCGKSDLSLDGPSESEMQAAHLSGLLRKLDTGPAAIIGGSGGSRVSMLAAARDPEMCSHLAVWWISGDPIGLMQLGGYYCGEAAGLASMGGMEAVLKATSWADNLANNPSSRDRLLAMRPDDFIAIMQKWCAAYVPSPVSPVPGMSLGDFARLTMPTLVLRSCASDLSHTRATSEWVARLIPQCRFVDPPWPKDEWNHRSGAQMAGTGQGLFNSWHMLAPQIADLVKLPQPSYG